MRAHPHNKMKNMNITLRKGESEYVVALKVYAYSTTPLIKQCRIPKVLFKK